MFGGENIDRHVVLKIIVLDIVIIIVIFVVFAAYYKTLLHKIVLLYMVLFQIWSVLFQWLQFYSYKTQLSDWLAFALFQAMLRVSELALNTLDWHTMFCSGLFFLILSISMKKNYIPHKGLLNRMDEIFPVVS